MKNRKTIIALTIAIVIVIATIAVVANNLLNTERIRNALNDVTDVRVATAMQMEDYITITVPVNSRIDVGPEPDAIIKVFAPLDGRIILAEKTIGRFVEQGAIVARYDVNELAVQKNQATARIGAAEAKLKQADREYAQECELFSKDATSRDKMNKAGELATIERQNLANERAGAGLVDQNLAKQDVLAPAAGFVTSVFVREGMQVTRGQALCNIVDPSRIVLQCEIPDKQASFLKVGRKGRIETVRGMSGKQTWSGELIRLQKSVHVQGDYMHLFIRLDDIAKLFHGKTTFNAGQDDVLDAIKSAFASGFIMHLQVPHKSIVVPRYAIMYKNGEPYVYIAKDGIAEQCFVQLGVNFGDDFVEAGGIKIGDQIITVGNELMAQGRKIRVVNARNGEANN